MKATDRPRRAHVAAAVVAIVTLGAAMAPPRVDAGRQEPRIHAWPDGTEVIGFDNLDGIILFNGVVRGADGRDSSGWFVLDTGAGYLALDVPLAA